MKAMSVSWFAVALTSVCFAACAVNDGGGTNRDGGRGPGLDGSGRSDVAFPDGTQFLADGRVVLPDGATYVPPPDDAGGTRPDAGGGIDASEPLPDGAVVLPDGAIVLPDGAIYVRDGGGGADAGSVPTCGPTEICDNGLDDNCNGVADENCSCLPGMMQRCYQGDPAQAGRGVCTFGSQRCLGSGELGEWGPCMGSGAPQPVVCGGGMDYRCDGVIDEGCGCTVGATRMCYDGPAGTRGVGTCRDGMETCVTTPTGSDWGPCLGSVLPAPNTCDGMDRMCDGMPVTGACACVVGTARPCYEGPAGTAGVGVCHGGSQTCAAGAGGVGASWGACAGQVVPSPNTCDGVDRMCNGMPSVGCACMVGQTRACYDGAAGTRGVGACRDGSQTCAASGGGAAWPTACPGETLPVAEICGNRIDDNCNGTVDEGCAGGIVCPADITVNAGAPVTLTATATSPGRTIASYSWTITAAPTGGIGTPTQWTPAPPTAMTEVFLAYIVGVYTIHVTATDSAGVTVGCDTHVTALGHGLRVQLGWNGSGDVDLHLHNGITTTPWFGTNDCYYGNLNPAWDGTNTAQWPQLDFDNVTANGPENTRIDLPVVGETYEIGVHNYSSAAGRIATVQVFCGGVSTPTATYTSRALAGTAAGNCTTSDFWRVARVVFTSPTACTVTMINTYGASSARCTAF